MFKIGLTGGICTGKSFILKIFDELKCYTIRADEIAKKIIFDGGSKIRAEIVNAFGPEVLNQETGILNKEVFTKLLFEDAEKRIFINNLVHPLVKAERTAIVKSLESSKLYDFFIYESALLVESGIYKDFDKVIVVYTTPREQIERLMARDGLNEQEAEERIKSQFPLSEKLKVANYAIDTTGTFENTHTLTLETFHLMKKDLMGQ